MLTLVKKINKLSDITNNMTRKFAIVFFIVMTIATVIQVISRHTMKYSFSWTEEVARFTFIWVNMLGACIGIKYGTHATVSFVHELVPKKVSKILKIIVDLLITFGCVLMITEGMRIVSVTANQPSPAIRLPMSFIYISVPICGVIMLIHVLSNLFTLTVKEDN